VVLWPGFLLFHYVGVEPFMLPSGLTFVYLTTNGLIGTVISDLLWSAVVIFTSPLVATMGLSLTIPLALIADLVFHHKKFKVLYLVGSSLVFLGFWLANIDTTRKELELWEKCKRCCWNCSGTTLQSETENLDQEEKPLIQIGEYTVSVLRGHVKLSKVIFKLTVNKVVRLFKF